MFEAVTAGKPKSEATKNYASMATNIIELESKLAKASAEKTNARDVSVSMLRFPLSLAVKHGSY
jgi:hypothetical protein